jgi:hypothetical protein
MTLESRIVATDTAPKQEERTAKLMAFLRCFRVKTDSESTTLTR